MYINMNEVFRSIDGRKAAAASLKEYVGKEVKAGVHTGTLVSVDSGEFGAIIQKSDGRYGFDPRKVVPV